jgi:hypothetical protein
LFSTAGIEARWKNCRVAGSRAAVSADACADPIVPNEVIVRIVAAPTAVRKDSTITLGDAFVDPMSRSGSLATIYADRIVLLSRMLRTEPGPTVGRTVAHEVAHMLLGTDEHTTLGLMRATWRTSGAIQRAGDDWRFTDAQQLAMRLALDARVHHRIPQAARAADK